jgi:PHD/YefM family antitoxin component YafN of YafNO toxin-antitoxin module
MEASMFEVHVKQLSDITENYSDIAELLNNHDRIILTNAGKNEAVLINLDDYSEFESYAHKEYINKKLSDTETMIKNKETTWIDEEKFWTDD